MHSLTAKAYERAVEKMEETYEIMEGEFEHNCNKTTFPNEKKRISNWKEYWIKVNIKTNLELF